MGNVQYVQDFQMWSGQLLTIMMLAFALGFDAFSLGIGIGLRGVRYRHMFSFSFVVALFHMLLPIGGMLTGKMMSELFGEMATVVAGVLLAFLGINMIYNAFKEEKQSILNISSFWGMLLVGLSVSIDSFSVGITLGMMISNVWLTILIFGFCGGMMSLLGLGLGKKVKQSLGEYGEALGGVVLVVFGVYFIF